jgi:metal-sulfur cluster biosynthetic enzyme
MGGADTLDIEVRFATGMALSSEEVFSALSDCLDPDTRVNVVDLGLIYNVTIQPTTIAGKKGDAVEVEMTLTMPDRPVSSILSSSIRQRLLELPSVLDVAVKIVWSPPWTPDRISPDARKQLGMD